MTNSGNGLDDFDLLTTQSPGTAISVVSITGTGVTQGANPDSARVANLAASDSAVVTVTYSVADVAAGVTDTLLLTANPVGDPATTDDGRLELTVVRPNITTVKEAWLDDQSAQISGNVLPGDTIQYKVLVTNSGDAPAVSVHVDDLLPSDMTFVSATGDEAGWTFTNTGNDLDADLSGTLAAAASRFFWIRVTVN